jgi:Tol biopolymer transport system component
VDKDSAELMTTSPGYQFRPNISPDGRWLLYFWNDENPGHPRTRLMRMPLAGGAAQEVLAADNAHGLTCSSRPEGACILIETRGKLGINSLFDPVKGRGPKVLEITVESGPPAISPDGRHIGFVLPGTPKTRIQMADLHGASESEVTVSGAEDLESLDWSSDGTGFFTADNRPETPRLLFVQRNGTSHVLWTQPAGTLIWGIPSPNGRYLATFKTDQNANVWIVENP